MKLFPIFQFGLISAVLPVCLINESVRKGQKKGKQIRKKKTQKILIGDYVFHIDPCLFKTFLLYENKFPFFLIKQKTLN